MTSTDDKDRRGKGEKRPNQRDIAAPPEGTPQARLPFPVVGIGASAGGIQALEEFFTSVDPDSGMAYVVVQHLSPDHTSMLGEILGRDAEDSRRGDQGRGRGANRTRSM